MSENINEVSEVNSSLCDSFIVNNITYCTKKQHFMEIK